MGKALFILSLLKFSISVCIANNVSIAIASIHDNRVVLDVAWENAWNTTDPIGNHDAVWVFLKSNTAGSVDHLNLKGCRILTPGVAKLSRDNVGLMLSPPVGSHKSVTLAVEVEVGSQWQGQLQAHAIEMVYCPPGVFWLGDSLSNNTFSDQSGSSYRVSDEGINFHSAKGLLQTRHPTPDAAIDSLVSAVYPNGIQGFYLMKYEINQKQFAAFLESQSLEALTALLPDFNGNGYVLGESRYRSAIRIGLEPTVIHATVFSNQSQNGENRACAFLNWGLLASYLDWSGLRPMTEHEFEKACRGPLKPNSLEFAWGTANAATPSSLVNDGNANEQSLLDTNTLTGVGIFSKPVGNAYIGGPARNGFSAKASSARVESGASYYGCFELSGNVWELCVKATNHAQNFAGQHGDGNLSNDGTANVEGWPGVQGITARGGGWNSLIFNSTTYPFRDLAISDRFYANTIYDQIRNTTGGRGCRSL